MKQSTHFQGRDLCDRLVKQIQQIHHICHQKYHPLTRTPNQLLRRKQTKPFTRPGIVKMGRSPFTTYIHIGHGKTGTTAIQSALALCRKELRASGIIYPIKEEIAIKAEQLQVTSGNWPALPNQSLRSFLLEAHNNFYEKNASSLVFSSENIFWKATELTKLSDNELTKINPHVILAVRDIEEMLSSEYLQMVKRHGESRSFSEYLKARNYKSGHHHVSNSIIQQFKKRSIKLSLLNYSKSRYLTTRFIFNIIGASNIEIPSNLSKKIVNRSLSNFELKAVLTLNSLYGQALGSRISDELVEQLPEVTGNPCEYTDHDKKMIYDVNQQSLVGINHALEKSEHLHVSPRRPTLLYNFPELEETNKELSKLSASIIKKCLSEHLSSNYSSKETSFVSSQTIKKLEKISGRKKLDPDIRHDILKIIDFFKYSAQVQNQKSTI